MLSLQDFNIKLYIMIEIKLYIFLQAHVEIISIISSKVLKFEVPVTTLFLKYIQKFGEGRYI